MNILRGTLIGLLFFSTSVIAAPASESSIKELLAVSQQRQIMRRIEANFSSYRNHVIQQALKGMPPRPFQQQAIANYESKLDAIVQEEIAWEKIEPIFIRLYERTFTEKEVTDMVAFYKTPTGQAVIHKMPGLMQSAMVIVREDIADMMPKLQEAQKEFQAEMAAARK